ncbi:MAG TPA: SAM-dependent methyltransferase [Vicinamibacterales bacterium]|nr:SAM-dependent methyltransferase [Vicinamibacterales bacterium]
MTDDPLIRDISDTARWVAVYRARETDRADAIFKDPFARALAGERGEQIAGGLPFFSENAWSMIARTYLFDRFVMRLVKAGVDLIVNLAAGLDARPYRMELPASLRWVEVDLPEILDYKAQVLADAKPTCTLERIPLDLSNADARRGLFDRLGRSTTHAAVLTEGLLIYLMAGDVGALGWDLARQPSFRHWIVDIVSPGLMQMLRQRAGEHMMDAGAPFLFAPPEGPPFFSVYGWTPVEVKSILKTAGKLGRLPLTLRMLSLLPESTGRQGDRPWSGVVLLQRR